MLDVEHKARKSTVSPKDAYVDCGPHLNKHDEAEDSPAEELFDDKGIVEIKMPPDDAHFVKDVCVDEGARSPEKVLIELDSRKEEFGKFDQLEKDEKTDLRKKSILVHLPVSFGHSGELKNATSPVHSPCEIKKNAGEKILGEQISLKQLLVLENSTENRALCRINFDYHKLLDGRSIGQCQRQANTTTASETGKISRAGSSGDEAPRINEVSVDETSDVHVLKGSDLNVSGSLDGTSEQSFPDDVEPEISDTSVNSKVGGAVISGLGLEDAEASNRKNLISTPPYHLSVANITEEYPNLGIEKDDECEVCSLCDFNPRSAEAAASKTDGDLSSKLLNHVGRNPFLDVEDDLDSSVPADLNFFGPSITSCSVTTSGQIPNFGNTSLRSDGSATSNRSFAFPVLQSEWNTSPVKMAKATRRRGWKAGLLCCKF